MTTIPIQKWLRATVSGDEFLVFSYHDRTSGISAKGSPYPEDGDAEAIKQLVDVPSVTLRMGGVDFEELKDDEVQRLGLPDIPKWALRYEKQEPYSKPWHKDQQLAGLFHGSFSDDLQALFAFVEERTSELMWVRLTERDEAIEGYKGVLQNTPETTNSLKQGDEVAVRMTPGVRPSAMKAGYPPAEGPLSTHAMFYINAVVRSNLAEYEPRCGKCGFDLYLHKRKSPTAAGANLPPGFAPVGFSSPCLMCGDVTIVRMRELTGEGDGNPRIQSAIPQDASDVEPDWPPKKWWQFWR
jgi:hypothetical protein